MKFVSTHHLDNHIKKKQGNLNKKWKTGEWRTQQKKKKDDKNQTKLSNFKKTEITLHNVITKENFVMDKRKMKEFMKSYKHPHRLMILGNN